DARDAGIEQRVEHREPEDGVAPQPLVVLDADEIAAAADPRVGERYPNAEAERIGEEQDQERRRRQHEPGAEPAAVDLEPLPRARFARNGSLNIDDRFGHCVPDDLLSSPLPTCGERSTLEARRVRGSLWESRDLNLPLTPTLSRKRWEGSSRGQR